MRLFVALDIDEEIRTRISRFLDGVRGFAPEARWVQPESLHVTLKFIGEKSEDEMGQIKRALENIRGTAFQLNFRGYGFFPTARAPRVFWSGVESDQSLSLLAAAVDKTLVPINIPKEEHAFNPHLTLARAGSSRSNKLRDEVSAHGMNRLREKLASLPSSEFGTMTAREFFLYQSQPSPKGSRYTKLARFALQ
jgi:RNA 2',3'-cyclic 3'-phosphodiesterase